MAPPWSQAKSVQGVSISKGDAPCAAGWEEDEPARAGSYRETTKENLEGVAKRFASVFGIPGTKLKVVGNGLPWDEKGWVNVGRDELRYAYGIPRDRTVLLQVGTLSKRKNHVALLRALSRMDSALRGSLFHLIVGDGEEKKHLVEPVHGLRLDACVRITGWVSEEQPQRFYHLSDFLILPSSSEGLPSVFLEALRAGLPIITFADLEGVTDVYHPPCMELIPDRNQSSIVNTIRIAISKSWDRDAIRKHSERWNWDNIGEEYRRIYMDLMTRVINQNGEINA